MPDLEEPEQLVAVLAQQHLSTFLYVLFAGALISAILSTVDSCLLAAASLVSHNLIVPLKPTLTERGKITTARIGVVVFGIVAYVIALCADGIYELVATASAFGSAGIFVVGLFGLFSRVGGAASAYAALVAGVVVWAAGEYWLEWSTPYVAAVAAALAAYLAAAALAPRAAARPEVPSAAFELRCRHAFIATGGYSNDPRCRSGRRSRRRDPALRDAVRRAETHRQLSRPSPTRCSRIPPRPTGRCGGAR